MLTVNGCLYHTVPGQWSWVNGNEYSTDKPNRRKRRVFRKSRSCMLSCMPITVVTRPALTTTTRRPHVRW